METVFPGNEWERVEPQDVGMDAEKLEAARQWHQGQAGENPFRIVVVRAGRMVAEWEQGVATDERRNMASATKSVFSSVLGVALAEGKIGSPDDLAVDYYPEMMDVPEGKGPKPGRFAKPEDRGITLRQLISNTSGYMKPGETPGSTFHYQTFGMNIFCHAIEMAYGLYDSSDPDRLPGFGKLMEEKIRNPIGGVWAYRYTDFQHPPEAVKNIFGHSPRCDSNARDMARMGLLWLHFGRWEDNQVIQEDWMRQATKTSPDIMANNAKDKWKYGHGFWVNDHGVLWPALPKDSFAASGAAGNHIWVCPSLDMVVSQSPNRSPKEESNDISVTLLERIVAACK